MIRSARKRKIAKHRQIMAITHPSFRMKGRVIPKIKQKDSDQTIVSLKFRGDVANEPIIANLIRKYNLDVSILYGSIDYIQNVSFGRLIIMINGHEEDMKKALGHLQSLPITSEVIGYVPSDN